VDEFNQKVEAYREVLGPCYHCGIHAYRRKWVTIDGTKEQVLVCTRENMRVERRDSLRNLQRKLRDKDIALGRAMIAKGPDVHCTAVLRAINALRKRDGEKPVGYSTVKRRVCSQCKSYRGMKQGE
jgi:hypothetical protein